MCFFGEALDAGRWIVLSQATLDRESQQRAQHLDEVVGLRRRGGDRATRIFPAVVGIGYVGVMVGPPVIGALAEHFSLRGRRVA